MTRVLGSICAGLLLVVLCSCMTVPTGIASSTKPLDPGGYSITGPATGHAYGIVVFGFPLAEPYPCRAATTRAINNGGGDAMVNVTIDSAQVFLGPISIVLATVKGTGVQSADG